MHRIVLCLIAAAAWPLAQPAAAQTLFPAARAAAVNPDVQLKLTFRETPIVGRAGQVRIYDAATDRLVDTLDLSVPPGPTQRATGPIPPYLAQPYPYARRARAINADTRPGTPSAGAEPTPDSYQLTIIGGFTDGFHFYPVTVDRQTATLHPHHDKLRYGHSYYVQVDPGVLSAPGFQGVSGKAWRFTTKPAAQAPRPGARRIVVSADGAGDFNTVQGAIDFVPDHGRRRVIIVVRPGLYEEIVYFRNKDRVTFLGSDAERTVVRYANNEVFNPHPANLSTNERPGTFPSRRAAFAADNSNDIHLVGMTFETTAPGQSEGLLVNGQRNILSHVKVIGGGDALQVNGSVYVADSVIEGTGDTILGRGPAFFERTTLRSTRVFMWIRNTEGVHGNVFKDCVFVGSAEPTDIARSPENRGRTYPFAEAVLLHATLSGIRPEGFGEADTGGHVHFWEFDSRTPAGAPVDVSRRSPLVRQLDKVRDAQLVADYSRPAFVLGGWTPRLEVAP